MFTFFDLPITWQQLKSDQARRHSQDDMPTFKQGIRKGKKEDVSVT